MTADIPYVKTRAGVLQLPKMPWDLKNDGKFYAGLSILSLGLGILV